MQLCFTNANHNWRIQVILAHYLLLWPVNKTNQKTSEVCQKCLEECLIQNRMRDYQFCTEKKNNCQKTPSSGKFR